MKLSRNLVTPCIAFLFIAVGITGVLMFFHLLEGYTKAVHEILGLAFFVFSILHIILNWRSLKTYFNKKLFMISGIVILLITAVLVVEGKKHQHHGPRHRNIERASR